MANQPQTQSKPVQSSRDELRSKIFSHTERRSQLVTVFGAEIEVRQPTIGVIMEVREKGDAIDNMVHMLVNYCFVPGTDVNVFEPGDKDALLAKPWGPDFSDLNKAVADLTGVSLAVEAAEKN